MVSDLDTHRTTFFWGFTPYFLVITLLITPILLFVMPKRKAASTETMTTTIRTKKAKTQTSHYSGSSSSGPSPIQQNIRKIFDTYRDNAASEPDTIGMEGVMKYFEAIDVALDDVSFVVAFDLLDAPTMGEFSRDGFVTGWTNASTPSNPCDTLDRQKAYIKSLVQKLSSDPSYFKQVYKGSFKYAKPEGQRAIPVEHAFAFWDMFFSGQQGGIDWSSPRTKWYDLWRKYYTSKNNRPVNKDLWNQVAELVSKTREPGGESLSWWSEDGAWPTAVDDFVAFVKERRGADGMETS